MNSTKCGMLKYADHLQIGFSSGHCGKISLFWCNFNLAKCVKFWVSGYFLENTWKEWPELSVCWCILTASRNDSTFDCSLLIFLLLTQFSLSETSQILGSRTFYQTFQVDIEGNSCLYRDCWISDQYFLCVERWKHSWYSKWKETTF